MNKKSNKHKQHGRIIAAQTSALTKSVQSLNSCSNLPVLCATQRLEEIYQKTTDKPLPFRYYLSLVILIHIDIQEGPKSYKISVLEFPPLLDAFGYTCSVCLLAYHFHQVTSFFVCRCKQVLLICE